MRKRDERLYLRDILDAIEQTEAYLQGVVFAQLASDRLLQDGVLRQLEIIGEATPLT